MADQRHQFCITPELKKDWPFFTGLGFFLGCIQKLSYELFDGANAGSDLLSEHIAINSIFMFTLLLWLLKGLDFFVFRKFSLWSLEGTISHVSRRVAALGSVAAMSVVGFAAAAATFGAYFHAAVFFKAAIYLASVTEVAITPATRAHTNWWGFGVALSFVISVPFTMA